MQASGSLSRPGGEFVRAYLLMRQGVSLSRGSASVTVQFVFDFLALGLVGSPSVLRYRDLAAIVLPLTPALTLGAIAFAYGPMIWRKKKRQQATGSHGLRRFYIDSRQMLAWRPLVVGLALAIAAVAVAALTLLLVSHRYAISLDFCQSSYIYSLSQLAGALSMLPHGLGAVEASSVALFQYADVDSAAAASAIAMFRLATVGWSMLIGAFSLMLLRTPLAGPESADAETGSRARINSKLKAS